MIRLIGASCLCALAAALPLLLESFVRVLPSSFEKVEHWEDIQTPLAVPKEDAWPPCYDPEDLSPDHYPSIPRPVDFVVGGVSLGLRTKKEFR